MLMIYTGIKDSGYNKGLLGLIMYKGNWDIEIIRIMRFE
jgi:hypothetical protein